jgi:hypothetical protein
LIEVDTFASATEQRLLADWVNEWLAPLILLPMSYFTGDWFMKRKFTLTHFLICMVALFVLTGCGGSSSTPSSEGSEMDDGMGG